MLHKQPKSISWVFTLFSLCLFLSCDQDLTTPSDAPEITYTILAQDSLRAQPLDSVRIEARSEYGDTALATTALPDGKATLKPLFGRKTSFLLTRPGYQPFSFTDTLPAADSASLNIARFLQKRLLALQAQSEGKDQLLVLVRDAENKRLTGWRITATDSDGVEQTFEDADSNGQVGLRKLSLGENLILVEQQGYLGKWVAITVTKTDSATSIPRLIVNLLPRSYTLRGQVYAQGSAANYPFTTGAIEFQLKDSLAEPRRFRALLGKDAGKEGAFELKDLPALDGDLRVFRTANGIQPVFTKALTGEEIQSDGPLPTLLVKLPADSTSEPLLVQVPPDTLKPSDTLRFVFNQKVAVVESMRLGLINVSSELLITAIWDSSGRQLSLVQRDDTWIPGKFYDYAFRLRNAQGQYFRRPEDSAITITGSFGVRSASLEDSAVKSPQAAAWAYFNSGENPRFDSLSLFTSPLADSSTRFARLKWSFGAEAGRKVDSIVVFLKDEGQVAANWSRFAAFPASLDSAALDFSLWYSLRSGASQKPLWPLRQSASAIIRAQLVPKHRGLLLDSGALDLPPLKQGMGPSLWVAYDTLNGLNKEADATDTLLVRFRMGADTSSNFFDFGSQPPTPKLTLNGIVDTTVLAYAWLDGKTGRLIYRFNGFPPLNTHIRADLHGLPYGSGPLWIRNRQDEVVMP